MRSAVAAASLALSLAGCCAVHLAPALTEEEARLLAAHGPVGTCVVTGSRVVVWDTGDVAGSGLFTAVQTDDALAEGFHPDWYVESRTKRRPQADPIFDLWLVTKLTLGIIPTIRTDDEAIEYAIRRADELLRRSPAVR